MVTPKIQDVYNFIIPLIKECGHLFLKAKNENIQSENKTVYDLVTEYDKRIETILIERIKLKYPDHKFIGEEESESKNNVAELTQDPTWIIDPIDGTTNFTKKLPQCGISVGFTIKKEQVIGVVYMPYMDELYTAVKGQGSFLNGRKISCNKIEDPNKSLFAYEISCASKNADMHNLIMTRLSHLIKEVLAVRCFGCPILSLCYVASGKLDAYQCDGLYPWDAAAGTLIVTEAGGHVVESSGKKFDMMTPNFLATCTETLGNNFLDIEKKADEERENKKNKRHKVND